MLHQYGGECNAIEDANLHKYRSLYIPSRLESRMCCRITTPRDRLRVLNDTKLSVQIFSFVSCNRFPVVARLLT